jgi:DNA helicase II / ATP-dependent DNA helicase PcrA
MTQPRGIQAPVDSPERLRELMQTSFTFSSQQYAAISAPLEPTVVIAGAGSGKTTVMAARVVWLIANGLVAPDQILGLTFTTKAAAELAASIREAMRSSGLLPQPSPAAPGSVDADEILEPTVATYNAYAATLLTEQGLRIGHEPDARVLADASRYQLAARAIARYTGEVRLLSDHPGTVINYVLSLDAAMSEHLVGPEDVRRLQERERPAFEEAVAAESRKTARGEIEKVLNVFDRRDELLGLVEAYRDLKQRLGLIDFSDQIALAARLADEHPDVGEAERDKYRVVLLDEYQDTSVAQARLLRRLFSGDSPRAGRGHPVMAVGDPNQAIYGWRGASVSNILGFGADFPRPDGAHGDVHSLTVNRRSDQRILDVANRLAAPLRRAAALVQPLSAPPDAAAGEVRTAVLSTYADELEWLPDQVKQAHAAVPGRPWSEIGVLTRDNAHAADVFDALSDAEIPVEIVGLQGLLRLPEVAEVVATLTLLHDLTANAELLTLLTGPRWSIGARDLALLGRRAAALAGGRQPRRVEGMSIREELATVVVSADPTEIPSLSDALDDPGDGDYSIEARERFALLSDELRRLRRHVGEPLIDLVRRIVDTTGIDVELASSVSPAARARRDNLDLFVKAVAEFQAVDGDVTLPALLAYLEAEDEFGTGLDIATPTEADSVKLLTVHRAKGLEWDAVFLVGVAEDKFPILRSRIKWTSGPGVLPTPLRGDARDQPALRGHDAAALEAFGEEAKQHQAVEERRLGYVAFTRARHLLAVSSYVWSATRKSALGPSEYQIAVRDALADWGEKPESWIDKPDKDAVNPLHAVRDERPWPVEAHRLEVERRVRAAAEVMRAIAAPGSLGSAAPSLTPDEAERVDRWDHDIERLLAEARRAHADVVAVPLPTSLSATALARLRDDPAAFAADLARPMPRPPSPAARFGTRFHAWVEARFGQQQILDPDDLPGRADAGIDSDSELADLIERFEQGPFADRPPVALEAPFAVVLAGQVVRGRIDAVYDDGDGYLVVDWKTGRDDTAEPLQLAVYRVAWAELAGVRLDKVGAAFYYVRSGEVVEPSLPDRAGIESLIARADPSGPPTTRA